VRLKKARRARGEDGDWSADNELDGGEVSDSGERGCSDDDDDQRLVS
jgi:hypothetical protein